MRVEDGRVCGSCRFFVDLGKKNRVGQCRFMPPVWDDDSRGRDKWPRVAETDFCGQHELGAPRVLVKAKAKARKKAKQETAKKR